MTIILEKKLLFDASSLIYALKLKCIDILYENYIQYLTIYEAINAIWKEAYLIKSLTFEEAKKLTNVIIEVLNYLNMLSIHPYESEVLAKAVETGLTVYDASYIVLAKKKNLKLVTEDKELMRKAHRTIKVTSIRNLIKQKSSSLTS